MQSRPHPIIFILCRFHPTWRLAIIIWISTIDFLLVIIVVIDLSSWISPPRRFSQREKPAHQHTSAHYQALHERQATRIQKIPQPLPSTQPKQGAQNQRQVQRKSNRRQLCVMPRGNPHSQNGRDKINQQSPQKGLHPERRGVKQRRQNRLEPIKARKVELQKFDDAVDVPKGGKRVVAHAREGLKHVRLRIKRKKRGKRRRRRDPIWWSKPCSAAPLRASAILLVASLEYSDRKEAFADWRARNHWKRERCDERLQLGFQGLRVLHELAR